MKEEYRGQGPPGYHHQHHQAPVMSQPPPHSAPSPSYPPAYPPTYSHYPPRMAPPPPHLGSQPRYPAGVPSSQGYQPQPYPQPPNQQYPPFQPSIQPRMQNAYPPQGPRPQPPPPPRGNAPMGPPPPSAQQSSVVRKKGLADLAAEIDPAEVLDEDVKELLLQLTDDLLDRIVDDAEKVAKHRRSDKLELCDVQTVLKRHYNIFIPGFGDDALAEPAAKKPAQGPTDAALRRKQLISKGLRKA